MPHFLDAALGARQPSGLQIERTGAWLVSSLILASDSATRRRGLLGRSSIAAGEGLVIAPSQGVHTFGMRFAIDIVGVARDGSVVKVRNGVPPRRIVLALSAFAIVELPAGTAASLGLRVGDRLRALAVADGPQLDS